MCTLSWNWSDEAFHLFFNRDESLERPEALAPQTNQIRETNILSPIDPQGGGTWVGINEYGLAAALVNDYQYISENSSEKFRSRGLLVMDVLALKNLEEVKSFFNDLEKQHYQGFLLHVFSFEKGGVQLSWNGKDSEVKDIEHVAKPVSSHALCPKEAREYREENFRSDFSLDQQREFHALHDQEHPGLSPWMLRQDARTHSFTELQLSADEAKMWYAKSVPLALQTDPFSLRYHDR